jgi:hypothetical protein
MSAAEPILIGYFPKRTAMPTELATPPHVVQFCNAGFCDGLAPKDWVDLWLHNEFWLYDTEMLAWAVATQTENLRRLWKELAKNWDGIEGSVQAAVDQFIARHVPPPGASADWENTGTRWDIFAYRLSPTLFVAGQPEAIRFPSLKVRSLTPDYERLGYDVVVVGAPGPEEVGFGDRFAHSPLSPWCNGRWEDIPVNRFCLLDTPEEGLRWGQEFSSAKRNEEGPYVAVEVWRKRRDGL